MANLNNLLTGTTTTNLGTATPQTFKPTAPTTVAPTSGALSGDAQVLANQQAAAKLGITIPGVNGALNQIAPVTMPNTKISSGNTSDATSLTAGAATQIDTMQKFFTDQANLAKQQADALQSNADNAKSSILSIFNSTPTSAQTRADAYAKIGIDPATYFADQKTKITEIDSLNKEYNAVKAAADQQKAQLTGQGRGITTDFLDNQAAQIDRNAAPKLNELSANINSKAAVLQALQGNFNSASNLVNQAVADATADTKFKVDSLTTFYNMNKDSITRLDTQYQNAITQAVSLAKTQYDEQVQEKKTVGELMVNPIYAGAGIKITDSVDTARQKASQWATTHPGAGQTQTSVQNIGGRSVAVTFDATGNVIKQVDLGSAPNTGVVPATTNDQLTSILKAGGPSSSWTPDQWAAAEAQFVNDNLSTLGSVKAKSVFAAQFPKPATPKSPTLIGTIGAGINYLKGLLPF